MDAQMANVWLKSAQMNVAQDRNNVLEMDSRLAEIMTLIHAWNGPLLTLAQTISYAIMGNA